MNLGPKLIAKPTLKQSLTPGLVQMVSMLAMNKLELQDAIGQELLENPMLDEQHEEGPTSGEELAQLERELHDGGGADSAVRAAGPDGSEVGSQVEPGWAEAGSNGESAAMGIAPEPALDPAAGASAEMADGSTGEAAVTDAAAAETAAVDPFDEIDFGSYFNDYLDPGYRSHETEEIERPSFENFLSAPTTLSDHLRWQLSVEPVSEEMRGAAEAIIGNLDEDGYLTAEDERGRRPLRVDEIASAESLPEPLVHDALIMVQRFDPPGVAARDLRECLLIQLFQRPNVQILAITLVSEHLAELEQAGYKDLARDLNVTVPEIESALAEIRKLNPYPGRSYNPANTRLIEPDVAFVKGRAAHCLVCGSDSCPNEYQVHMNEEGVPQLRLNRQYRGLRFERDQREVARYIRDRYASALQFLKNLEQRKHTIARVCHSIVARQADFLNLGVDGLKPMMIKDVAEEIGVHPSTVSRAVANKYAHTPQGVYELRYFFTESVQGARGQETSLLILKRRVKRMIEAEDPRHPVTDERICAMLREQGISVTRRTIAKYREDMRIPSTHRRRARG